MKKILFAAVIVLAVSSLAFGQSNGENQNNNDQASAAQCSTLTFITESLPDFHVGVPANFQIEVSGGTPPYRFEITDGALPAGLTLDKHGRIRGTPTQEADTTVFVRVTDKNGCNLTQAFAVRVVSP